MKRVLACTLSIVLALVFLLTGCHAVKSTTSPPAPVSSPAATSAAPTSSPSAGVTGTPAARKGGVLNLYGGDPTTLDPARSGEATSIEYILQIFSGLVTLDENLKPVPDIASSWDVSADGKTYTFHLRDGVKFHSGRSVTAQDFKYSWERAASPATASPTAATYLGDIVGVKDMLAGRAKELSGVKVIDDRTLQVSVIEPKSYFLFKLTYSVAFVLDSENVQKGGEWWRKPNGTGPFTLKQWTAGDRLELGRNAAFYGRVANVDSVVFHFLAGLPMNLYETGDIDVASTGAPYLDRVTDKEGPFYSQLTSSPELSFFYFGFNTKQPPFDDANVRRAFSMALDKDKIVSLVFQGTVTRADGIVPPGIEGYSDKLKATPFDPARARDLIKQSKYGDVSKLPPITFTTAGTGGSIGGALQAAIVQWRENLGVDVQVRQLESDQFFYSLMQEKDNLFDMGWIADYPHQQDFLEVLFHSGSDINYGEYSNPAVDALLDKAGVEADKAKSISLYQQAEQMLIDDTACVPLYFGKNYVLVKPYVKNYTESPLGFAMLNQVWLDK
jgi:oligopeptide transport system substrate-binding protein